MTAMGPIGAPLPRPEIAESGSPSDCGKANGDLDMLEGVSYTRGSEAGKKQMRFYLVEPEVAGQLGHRTSLDRSTHPPGVISLHYEFSDWLGDSVLESFPAFIITNQAARKLSNSNLTGFDLDDVEISVSDEFRELNPDASLPEFLWLKPTGVAGFDDIGTLSNGILVLSEFA
ncbi:hypothetical protein [Rhizobium herbae]